MQKKLIIFDMDGTILDTLEDIYNSLNYALAKNNFDKKSKDEVRSYLGLGLEFLSQKALQDGVDKLAIKNVTNDFLTYYKKHCADNTKPYDGILQVLQNLKNSGYKLAVNSNKTEAYAKELAKFYFNGIFDFISGQRDGICQKPSADGVNFICEQLKCDKSLSIYIGDSEVDFKTAQNAKIEFIGCAWGFKGEEFLKQLGAKNIAKKPSDILEIMQNL